MKLVIMGASGLIGTKMVDLLTAGGHDVVAASRNTGVDVLTGEGLGDALADADVLVDVTNSPSFADGPVMDFFTTSTTNQVAAAKGAGPRRSLSRTSPEGCAETMRPLSPAPRQPTSARGWRRAAWWSTTSHCAETDEMARPTRTFAPIRWFGRRRQGAD